MNDANKSNAIENDYLDAKSAEAADMVIADLRQIGSELAEEVRMLYQSAILRNGCHTSHLEYMEGLLARAREKGLLSP